MVFLIESGAWESVFAMPGVIVDQYIKMAGKSQLRVILYLLRHPGKEVTPQGLSDALALHPDEVSQALEFWVNEGILCQKSATGAAVTERTVQDGEKAVPDEKETTEEQKPPEKQPPANEAYSGKQKKEISPPKRPRTVTRSPMNDPAVVAGRIRESREIRILIEETEVILGKNLRTWEADVLINLHDVDGMPVDVIVMVLQYAVARERATIRYIETTAQNWMEEGVDTIEKAEQKIRQIGAAHSAWKKISTLLRIDARKPSAREEEYVLRWKEQWQMSDELIILSYDRCVDATGKMSFAYMNKIFFRWHSEGYTTAKQVEEGEATPVRTGKQSAGKKEKSMPSFDLDAFEQLAMNGELMENVTEDDG